MPDLELPLRTDRLTLRTYRPDDETWLLSVYSRPDVARYLLDEPWDQARATDQIGKRLPRVDLGSEVGALALVIEQEGRPVGDVALWLPDKERPEVAEIGWVLDPDHGGHGYAREAVTAVLDLAFDHYGLHRVAAQMDARNTSSARLAEAVGMRPEAHLRQDWWSKGEWTDTLVFGMLASDRD